MEGVDEIVFICFIKNIYDLNMNDSFWYNDSFVDDDGYNCMFFDLDQENMGGEEKENIMDELENYQRIEVSFMLVF